MVPYQRPCPQMAQKTQLVKFHTLGQNLPDPIFRKIKRNHQKNGCLGGDHVYVGYTPHKIGHNKLIEIHFFKQSSKWHSSPYFLNG